MSERRNPSRRSVIRGSVAIGGGVASSTLLTACGGSPSAEQSSSEAREATSGSIAIADVPVGGGVVVASTQTVVTQPVADEFHAFSSVCTHQGCAVGRVTAEEIICPCHSSRFDTRTGEPVGGPADRPLGPRTVTVTETEVEYS